MADGRNENLEQCLAIVRGKEQTSQPESCEEPDSGDTGQLEQLGTDVIESVKEILHRIEQTQ
jgi:hypothetical protein